MLKCPRKNKNCTPSLFYKCKGGNFICSGIAKKGNKYNDDKVWLCLRGQLAKTQLEMTPHEAALMVSSLSASIGESLPKIVEKVK